MINCVKCHNPLVINIDAKNKEFKCRDCSEKYEMFFEKKMLKICNKNKNLIFFINDLSNCDKDFSLKNVYEMYNKGYLDCVKSLNSKYNQSDNLWRLSINKLKDKIKSNINIKMNALLNAKRDNYFCNSCGYGYNDQEALSNNYSCIICSSDLIIKDDFKEIESLKNNLLSLNNDWSTLF